MKKLIALVLALSLVLMACGAAFAAEGDPQLQVTGLDGAVSADYYKVIEWDDTVGWKWAAPYSTDTTTFTAALLQEITGKAAVIGHGNPEDADYVAPEAAVEGKITSNTANTIAGVSNSNALTGGSISSGTWTATIPSGISGAGLYMVVPTGSGDVLFNPVFIAANHGVSSPITYAVPASGAGYSEGSMAKRSTITVDKTADKYTFNGFVGNDYAHRDTTKPGDTIKFTISTTAPKFAASYTNPVFKVSDQVSTGMVIKKSTIVVTGAAKLNAGTDYTLTFDDADPDHFVVSLSATYLSGLTANQAITITYDADVTNEAPLTVNEEDNTVTVNFSNAPDDTEGHGHKHDKTKHWTFSLDASVLGNESYKTSELVKVGLKPDGTEETATKTYSNSTQAHALEGASFQLKNNAGTVIRTVTTDEYGYIKFDGLDVGTYTLTEVSAPTGYIKDGSDHTVVIDATVAHDYEEEWDDTCKCKYLTERLVSYSVTVDGTTTSTYHFDNGTKVQDTNTTSKNDHTTKIGNTRGTELPSTGGIGTTLFYVVGGLLVVGAAVVLVARRKAHE